MDKKISCNYLSWSSFAFREVNHLAEVSSSRHQKQEH